MSINVKRRKFIKNYVKTGAKEQSAILAGYSPKSARSTATELLQNPEVQQEITKVLDKAGLTDDKLAENLNIAIDKGVNAERVSVSDGIRGIELAMRLKDKFPSIRQEITSKSFNVSLKGKSLQELTTQYNALLDEMQEFKRLTESTNDIGSIEATQEGTSEGTLISK